MLPVTTLIVDEDLARVAFLTTRLEYEPDFQVVGFATTAAEGVDLARSLQPAIVISDFDLPDLDGRTVTQRLRQTVPNGAVVLYTATWSRALQRDAMLRGADECLDKSTPPSRFIQTLRDAAARRTERAAV